MADLFAKFDLWRTFNCFDHYYLNHFIGHCCTNSNNRGLNGDNRICNMENCPKVNEFNKYLEKEKIA